MRCLRPREDFLQFLPEPSLPQVPISGQGTLVGEQETGPSAYSLLPRGLHPSGGIEPIALRNQRIIYGLCQGREQDLAGTGKRSAPPWGPDRFCRPASYLVTHPDRSSPYPLHRYGRWLSLDGKRWIACRKKYFFPVEVLSRLFEGSFSPISKRPIVQGKSSFPARSPLLERSTTTGTLAELYRKEWALPVSRPSRMPKRLWSILAAIRIGLPLPTRESSGLMESGLPLPIGIPPTTIRSSG